jgi:hypothetical protein
MKNLNCRTPTFALALTLLFGQCALAAPVIITGSGANPAAIQSAVASFRAALGGANNGIGGSFTNGFREINWDGVPDSFASPNDLPLDFFNANSPRGTVFDGIYGSVLRVSADNNNPTNTPVRFGDIDPSYPGIFQTFSDQRLFADIITIPQDPDQPAVDIVFFIPGTKIPATVTGFGAVFTDLDLMGHAVIVCYGRDGLRIPGGVAFAPIFNNGLSFAGITFNAGERISRIRVISGSRVLAPGNIDSFTSDMVAMDDFIYGEPRAAEFHKGDFDGDGTPDFGVFRPSTGQWFIFNSGSATVSTTSFGLNGDIPIDGDFDGDRRADFAVFRPSSGIWYEQNSSNGAFSQVPFGLNVDKPVPGDYDEDGKTDIAVWRPSDGNYYHLNSSDGGVSAFHWGMNGDIPVGRSAP